MIRILLTHSYVPPLFWHDDLQMTIYRLNILPYKALSNRSRTQILYHRDLSYTDL